MLGSHSPLLGGLAIFVLAASAGIAVLVLQRQEPVRMLILGAASLLAGVGVVLEALPSAAIGLFFLGTTIAGVGFCTGSKVLSVWWWRTLRLTNALQSCPSSSL